MLLLIDIAHTAPVATCWVWYRVGARNEISGTTGLSHWVEHMLFKGTPRYPRGELDRIIPRNGGVFNAFTSADYTAYFATLPADRIGLAIDIEADRMVNAIFDLEEVERERTVIIAEREGSENDAEFWLNEAVMAAAYQVHPYRNEIIGWKSDLHAITRDELYTHYQSFYRPDNATLVIAGDVDLDTLLPQIEATFGAIAPGGPPPPVRLREPESQGERRVLVRRPGPASYVQIAYHATDCRHPDYAPLVVLDAVLSGAKPVGSAGTATHRSARLYRALVETEIAVYASSGFRAAIDPTLFEFSAMVNDGHSTDDVERGLLAEVTRVQDDGVSTEEITRIQKQLRAQIAYGAESVTSRAQQLGMWQVLDTHTRVASLYDQIAAVDAAAVQRVAQQYLTERRRTVGQFIPDGSAPETEGA